MSRAPYCVLTGTGAARTRLTEEDAKHGAQPTPFTVHEWDAMHRASARETTEKHWRIINEHLRAHNLR
jgi:hypothetical protein